MAIAELQRAIQYPGYALHAFQQRRLEDTGSVVEVLEGAKSRAHAAELQNLGELNPQQFTDTILLPALSFAENKGMTGYFIHRLPGVIKKWQNERGRREHPPETNLIATIAHHQTLTDPQQENHISILLSYIATPAELTENLYQARPRGDIKYENWKQVSLAATTRFAKALDKKILSSVKSGDQKTLGVVRKNMATSNFDEYFELENPETAMLQRNLAASVLHLLVATGNFNPAQIHNLAILREGLSLEPQIASRIAEHLAAKLDESPEVRKSIFRHLSRIALDQSTTTAWQQISETIIGQITHRRPIGEILHLLSNTIETRGNSVVTTNPAVLDHISYGIERIMLNEELPFEKMVIFFKPDHLLWTLLQIYRRFPPDNTPENRRARESVASACCVISQRYPELFTGEAFHQIAEKAAEKFTQDCSQHEYTPNEMRDRSIFAEEEAISTLRYRFAKQFSIFQSL